MSMDKTTRPLTDAKLHDELDHLHAELVAIGRKLGVELKPLRPSLTAAEVRDELDQIKASLLPATRQAIADLRPSQSEIYARKLRA